MATAKAAKPNVKQPAFEVYQDGPKDFKFRLKAANGEVIATSKSYTTKANAKNAIDLVREYAKYADFKDATVAE
ncbi:MAG: YegP family protein [Clostridiales bacterium]|jgi:uncharacterized protein YegP (UPF0339 family)|nr:YegP family protein [Clostridiales bacterium]